MQLFKCFKWKLSEIKMQIKEKNICHKEGLLMNLTYPVQ